MTFQTCNEASGANLLILEKRKKENEVDPNTWTVQKNATYPL